MTMPSAKQWCKTRFAHHAAPRAVFWGIGTSFTKAVPGADGTTTLVTTGSRAAKVAAHASAGGVMSELQGGKFGHGFVSAGITEVLSPAIGQVGGGGMKGIATRAALSAALGGTVSKVTGGKFANGAATSAFASLFNKAVHEATKQSDAAALQERANDIAETVRLRFKENPDAPVDIEWQDFLIVAQADFEQAGGTGIKDFTDDEFVAFARSGSGDSRFAGSALDGARYNFVNAPAAFSGIHNASDVNYYYQGMIWAERGATIGLLHRAIEAHNVLDAAKAGSWSERFRNINQIDRTKPWAGWC